MPDNFKQLLKLLEPDNLFLPKEIVARKDIDDHSKIMLGIVFTEHRFDTNDKIKEALKNTSDTDIIKEFGDNPHLIKRIKADFAKIIANFDLMFAGTGGE